MSEIREIRLPKAFATAKCQYFGIFSHDPQGLFAKLENAAGKQKVVSEKQIESAIKKLKNYRDADEWQKNELGDCNPKTENALKKMLEILQSVSKHDS